MFRSVSYEDGYAQYSDAGAAQHCLARSMRRLAAKAGCDGDDASQMLLHPTGPKLLYSVHAA